MLVIIKCYLAFMFTKSILKNQFPDFKQLKIKVMQNFYAMREEILLF